MARKSFSIHEDFYKHLTKLSTEQMGDIFYKLIDWASDGEATSLNITLDPMCEMLYELITEQINRFDNYSLIQSEKGKKGGAPKGNQNARKQAKTSKNKQKQAKVDLKQAKTTPITVTNTISDTVSISDTNNNIIDENEISKIMSKYMDMFGNFPSPDIHAKLLGFLDYMDCEVILNAFDISISENVKKWSYIKKILENYKSSGIITKSDVIADMEQFERRKSNNNSTSFMDIDTTGWESEELF